MLSTIMALALSITLLGQIDSAVFVSSRLHLLCNPHVYFALYDISPHQPYRVINLVKSEKEVMKCHEKCKRECERENNNLDEQC